MNGIIRRIRGVAVMAAVAVAGTGCAQMGGLGNVLGGVLGPAAGGAGGNNEVGGEVRYVDTRQQEIQFQLQDGRTAEVAYDSRTQVVYQQQQYPVTALEPGDYVVMRVQQDQQGRVYTDYILVQQSVQDRGGTSPGAGNTGSMGDYRQLQGYVGQVDYNRGIFEVRVNGGGTVTVSMPYNPGAYDSDRFRRLRNGDQVRLEGRYLTNNRFELYRFL